MPGAPTNSHFWLRHCYCLGMQYYICGWCDECADVPQIVGNVIFLQNRSVAVKWDPATTDKDDYEYRLQKWITENWENMLPKLKRSDTRQFIPNLLPGKTYHFRILSINTDRSSLPVELSVAPDTGKYHTSCSIQLHLTRFIRPSGTVVTGSDGQKLTKKLLTNSLITFVKLDH